MEINRTEKLKMQLERTRAKAREEKRKAQALGAKLTNQERADDTRRKILVGSWALEKAERFEEFRAAMQRDLDRVWLWRDDDRALFGLPKLDEEEKARRELSGRKPAKKTSLRIAGDEVATEAPSRGSTTQASDAA